MPTDVGFWCYSVLLCLAFRTPTGGQSSESTELSDAPFLFCPADSGDFHTHELKWTLERQSKKEKQRERERERESKTEFQRLKVKQDEEVKMASSAVFQVVDLSCIPKLFSLWL